MAVTINELLKLPAFNKAEVVAGKKNLNKIITSVSVLETADPGMIKGHEYQNDELGGSEIVITGFINIKDHPDEILNILRQLNEAGEAGVIVYYVGVFLPEIPQSVLKYANENGFVVICMPRKQEGLRYSDAISDIVTAIVHDRDRNNNLVVTLLDTIARLPENRQNIGTMVRLISEYLHVTAVLADRDGKPLYESAWPGEYSGISQKITKDLSRNASDYGMPIGFVEDGYLQKKVISTQSGGRQLFLISINQPVPKEKLEQAAEAVRVAGDLWNHEDDKKAIGELVSAILNDEPLKMRSLASLFHIDIASIHSMWVFQNDGLETAQLEELAGYAKMYCSTAFAGVFGKYAVLFSNPVKELQDADAIISYGQNMMHENCAVSYFSSLETTSDVRKAFLLFEQAAADAEHIFPKKNRYSEGDLQFAGKCRERINLGETSVKEALSPLNVLKDLRDAEAMLDTLSVYLLDTQSSILRTAEQMIVHKNTVKYRLGAMSDRLGYSVGEMPASWPIYLAVGVSRLIHEK